jgi:hypothetical protein
MAGKRPKICCEICKTKGCVLDRHHIIPRTDPNTSHMDSNLAILCANCHRRVHAGEYIIEGVFATSGGKHLFWHKAGDPHIVIEGVILFDDGTAEVRK